MRLAVECFADHTVLRFLKEDCALSMLQDLHVYSQGEVVRAVLIQGLAEVGMVDEDPNKPHHRKRDETQLIAQGVDVDVRALGGRHLLIVKPDLERCYLKAVKRLKLETGFGGPSEMHAELSRGWQSRKHRDFAKELADLRAVSREKSIPCFVTELEDALRSLVSRTG